MKKRRRSLHTVTVRGRDGVEKKSILAYSEPDAEKFYVAKGYAVLEVVKGDAINGDPSGPGWALAAANLAVAKEFLGLRWEVRITQTHHQGGRLGAYTLRRSPNGPYHRLTIKEWLTIQRAGEVLWHELTHAMQTERRAAAANAVGTDAIMRAWASDADFDGDYWNAPAEIEARDHEAFNAELPLARSI